MARAVFNGTVIAESDRFEVVEGNVYFPPESVRRECFRGSDHHTICGWKGTASYMDVVVGGEVARNAAWYYPAPKERAAQLKDHVAFYPAVSVEH